MAGGGAGSIGMTGGGVGRSRRASQAEQIPWLESMTGRADVGGLARWVRRWVSLVLLPETSSTKLSACEAGRGGSYSAQKREEVICLISLCRSKPTVLKQLIHSTIIQIPLLQCYELHFKLHRLSE